MMTRDRQEFCFLCLAQNSLDEALRCAEISEQTDDDFYMQVFADYAVLNYSKCFGKNKALSSGDKNFSLPDAWIPTAEKNFHERVCAARDQLIAHIDLAPHCPDITVSNNSIVGIIIIPTMHREIIDTRQLSALIKSIKVCVIDRLNELKNVVTEVSEITVTPA